MDNSYKSLDGKDDLRMTKEQLIAAGLTEEQANNVLAMRGAELTNLQGQIATLTATNTQLQVDSTELARIKEEGMTADELQQKAIDDANLQVAELTAELNRAAARESLISGGFTTDEIDDALLELMVSDSRESTVANCEAYMSKIKAKLEANETRLREELLKGTPHPEGSGGNGGDGEKKTPQQIIAEELANSGTENMKAAQSALDYYGGK